MFLDEFPGLLLSLTEVIASGAVRGVGGDGFELGGVVRLEEGDDFWLGGVGRGAGLVRF